MLVRKFTATTSLGLGAVLLSFSVPAIANATVDIGPGTVGAAATTDTPTEPTISPLPTDPTTSPEPTEPTATFPTIIPTKPKPTDPDPTTPTQPLPTATPPRPTTPRATLPVQPVKAKPARGVVDDQGNSDPGSDKSDEQGEKSADDPALGDPSDPGAVKPDSAVAPDSATAPQGAGQAPEAGALPNTGADANLTWMAMAGLGLIALGGVLLKRPHLARHRA